MGRSKKRLGGAKLFGIIEGELTPLETTSFASEEEVKKIFHASFSLILPHLVRLTELKEHVIGSGNQEGERPDDIAIDPITGIFYIIEFKNKLDKEALEQVRGYRNALSNDLSNRVDLRETYLEPRWNKEQIQAWGLWKSKSKDWEKMQAICIAPEFTDRQTNGGEDYLTLIKFTRYANGTLLLESDKEEITSQWGKVKKMIDIPPQVSDINQILSKSEQWVKDKVLEVDRLINQTYPNPLKGRVIYTWEYTYEQGKNKVLLVAPRQKSFTVYLQENKVMGEKLNQPLLKEKTFIQKFKVGEREWEEFKRLLLPYLKEVLKK